MSAIQNIMLIIFSINIYMHSNNNLPFFAIKHALSSLYLTQNNDFFRDATVYCMHVLTGVFQVN